MNLFITGVFSTCAAPRRNASLDPKVNSCKKHARTCVLHCVYVCACTYVCVCVLKREFFKWKYIYALTFFYNFFFISC